MDQHDEAELLRAVALRNADAIRAVRHRAEQEIRSAKDELEHKTAELARALDEAMKLRQFTRELVRAAAPADVARILCKWARDLMNADGATFIQREGDTVHYVAEDAIGPLWAGQRFPADACISGWAMLHRKNAVIADVYADDRIPVAAYRATFVRGLLMVPVREVGSSDSDDGPPAVIGAYWSRPNEASADQIRMLESIADAAAVALARAQLHIERRRDEEARARLGAIIESADDAIVGKTLEGVITSWNPGAERVYGYTAAEAVGQHITLIIPEERRAEEDEVLARLRRGEKIDHFETVRRAKDGRRVDISLTVSPIRSDAGRIIGASKIARDITARKRAEALLACQQEAFQRLASGALLVDVLEFLARALEHHSPHGAVVAIHLLDESGSRFVHAVAPSLPSTYAQATDGILVNSWPCGAAVSRCAPVTVSDVAASREFAEFASFALPLGIGAASSIPIVSSTGKVLGTIANYYRQARVPHAQDGSLESIATRTAAIVIERARAEHAMRQRTAQFETLLREAPLGVYLVDGDFRIREVNPTALPLFGDIPDLIGRDFDDIIHILWPKADADEIVHRFRHTLETGESYVVPERVEERLDRGAREVYEWQINRIPLPEGGHGVVCYFRDISAQVEAREAIAESAREAERAKGEAESANRAKDEFLATLSHELRTPLNSMFGWIRMLRAGTLDAVAVQHALEVVERNVYHQGRLITDLLDISSIISGKLTLEMAVVDLTVIVAGVVETIRPSAEAKSVTLISTLAAGALPVIGDADRLRQVVANLLSNALKFTKTGGRVIVRLERVDKRTRLTVSDTGKGISPAFLPHVFERFRQADASSTRAQAGLGLGLAIVRHIVELHQGAVQAASEGDGKGATFTVEFPLALAHGSPAIGAVPESETAGDVTKALDSVRILIVEDDADSRELLTAILTQRGAMVTATDTVAEALRVVRQAPPDVIVSDLALPGDDGFALMREIRSWPSEQGGGTPALALTAYARPEDRERALRAGFQSYLPKPMEPRGLIEAVSRLSRRP